MILSGRITRIAVSAALVMSIGITAYAQPTADSLNRQKQQLENQKNQYNQNLQQSQLNADSVEKDIENLNMQIDQLDSKIGKLTRTISDTKTKISAKEVEIQAAQKNLDKAEANIKSEQDLFNKRMRAMYIAGTDQYISVLLSSKDFDDFLSRVQDIVSIINFDNKLIKDLSDKKEKINADETALKKNREKLLAYKQDNESKLTDLQNNSKQQQQLIADSKSRQAYYMSQISDYKNKIEDENKQVQETIKQLQALALAQERTQAKGSSGSSGNIQAAPNAIIAYAYNFLGDPYVWGAEGEPFTQSDIDMYRGTSHDLTGMEGLLGRQAFDCSGFTQYVYAHFGIHVGRTTYDQINDGTPVSRSNLQPGNLIFFGSWDDPSHVGIYVGNNSVIEAPYSGGVVRVRALDDYLTARRILK